MSDKGILEFLRESLLSEDAPPLTDQEAEILLSVPTKVKGSPAVVRKLRKRFVEKLLGNLHQEPVRHVKRRTLFGAWLEEVSERARLTREDIAEAIGKDASFIERVESEELLPWTLTPSVLANIVILFRLHIDAVAQLLASSFEAKRQAEEYQRQLKAFLQNPGAPQSEMRAALINPAERRPAATEPTTPKEPVLDEKIVRLLEKLRKILEQRQATDLL